MSATDHVDGDTPQDSGADRLLDFRPGMPMWWEITRSTQDTGGELLETVNWVNGRTGGPPVHLHERAEESYEVIEGTLEVLIDGRWQTLHAGEKATVAPGTPHTLKIESDQPVKLINVHRPALRLESMFRELSSLIETGRIKRLPPKDPRSVIYTAMLFAKYSDEQRVTSPPSEIFKALALLGKALGLKLDTA
jgi:mannose-6-phosphate isomerase-like protein (cupin superfamily)